MTRELYRQTADALMSLTEYKHVPAALMAQFEGRKVSELTETEARALLRQIEWLRNRIKETSKWLGETP